MLFQSPPALQGALLLTLGKFPQEEPEDGRAYLAHSCVLWVFWVLAGTVRNSISH